MLCIAVALTGPETGWLTQTPALADRLQPLLGPVSREDIEALRADRPAACAALHRFALARSKEIARVTRVHDDPFEPILTVLEADSPVGDYRKIADEMLALRPSLRASGSIKVAGIMLIGLRARQAGRPPSRPTPGPTARLAGAQSDGPWASFPWRPSAFRRHEALPEFAWSDQRTIAARTAFWKSTLASRPDCWTR